LDQAIDIADGTVQNIVATVSHFGGAWTRDDGILFTPNPASPIVRVPADRRCRNASDRRE
jgi:hypothetical protein